MDQDVSTEPFLRVGAIGASDVRDMSSAARELHQQLPTISNEWNTDPLLRMHLVTA